jgi:hypothetical protein
MFSGFMLDRPLFEIPFPNIESLFEDPPKLLPNPIRKHNEEKISEYLTYVGLPHQIYEKPITWRARVCYDMTAVQIWIAVASKVSESIDLSLQVKQRILAVLNLWARFIRKIRQYHKNVVLARSSKRLGLMVEAEDKSILGGFQPYFLPSLKEAPGTHYDSYVQFVETNVLPSVTFDADEVSEIPLDCDTESFETKKKGSWLRCAIANIFDFYIDVNGPVESLLNYYKQLYSTVNLAMGGKNTKRDPIDKVKSLLNEWKYSGPKIVNMEDSDSTPPPTLLPLPQSGSKRKAEMVTDAREHKKSKLDDDVSNRNGKNEVECNDPPPGDDESSLSGSDSNSDESSSSGSDSADNIEEADSASSDSEDDRAHADVPVRPPPEKCPKII